MKIGVLGDLHNRLDSLSSSLLYLARQFSIDCAICVGDFSINRKTAKKIPELCLQVPLYVIDGNHDDFRFLNKANRKGVFEKWKKSSFHYMARGSTKEFDGVVIGFIGGALNIHTEQIIKDGNYITENDAKRTVEEFNAKKPDIIISHSCPLGIGVGIKDDDSYQLGVYENIHSRGYRLGDKNDIGEHQLKSVWDSLTRKPKLWIFGHFHRYQESMIDDTRFISLPETRDKDNKFLIIDTGSGGIKTSVINC